MERLESKETKSTTYYHIFYCDDCGKKLGTSKEYDDGYYDEYGSLELSFYLEDDGWYKVKKCFCEKCKEKYATNLIETLKKYGFERTD